MIAIHQKAPKTCLGTVQHRTKKCWVDVTKPTPDELVVTLSVDMNTNCCASFRLHLENDSSAFLVLVGLSILSALIIGLIFRKKNCCRETSRSCDMAFPLQL
jgi:LPXTG-motif cell wall-anchored protein